MNRKISPAQQAAIDSANLQHLKDGRSVYPVTARSNTLGALVRKGLVARTHRDGDDPKAPLLGFYALTEQGIAARTAAPAPIEVDALTYERREGFSSSQEGAYWVRREIERAQQAGTTVTVDEFSTIKIHSDKPVRFFPQPTPAPQAAPAAVEAAIEALEDQAAPQAHKATDTIMIGSGPEGAFTTFADSIETVDRWLTEGFLHKHTARQTPIHRDLCPCREAAAAPVDGPAAASAFLATLKASMAL